MRCKDTDLEDYPESIRPDIERMRKDRSEAQGLDKAVRSFFDAIVEPPMVALGLCEAETPEAPKDTPKGEETTPNRPR